MPTFKRAKSKYKSARAAWAHIASETRITPSDVKIVREATDEFYVWKITDRKRLAAQTFKDTPFKRRRNRRRM